MLTHQNVCSLWLLLLLHVSGNAFKLNLFGRNPEPREGDVRLFGSNIVSEGRVEIYHEGKWGTVCDDGWDMAEAQVVCRQLRFPGAKSVVIGRTYVEAPGPLWLDDVNCKGTESYLSTCGFKGWGLTDCTHKEDVGVICETAGANLTKDDSTHSLDHSISLSDELGQIFDSGDGCDFLIVVQSATGNKQEDGTPEMAETTICAHKMILSRFPFFRASEETTNITVTISQSCQPHFTSFIRYMYTHKMDVTFSSVQCLHWMASEFGVKQLMEDTGRLFSKILPEDASFHTQVSLYEYAEETGDLVLQENCIQYLAWNFQNLTRSPAWTGLSVELLGALLSRTDLVVPDEYFLLQTLESWITEKGNSTSLETQVDLLSRIRFPMIPAEKLYELQSKSSLYNTHKNMYNEHMLKALQFNVLLFSNLPSNQKFNKEDDGYLPRTYTAEPWSSAIDLLRETSVRNYNSRYDHRYPSGSPYSQTFSTPVHNSLIFKNNKIRWETNILKNQRECSNRDRNCNVFTVARLSSQNQLSQHSNILFRNQLLLICQGKYICHVQDFKDNLARITVNGTEVFAYPCPNDKYIYRFVVRPEYRRNPEPQDGDVRLFGSNSVSEGRVEIYHEGKWGTVCDDGWDMAEAQVLCRQLHFPQAKSVVTGGDYGEAPGPIWLDDVNCKGTESYLSTCGFRGWGVTDCTHKEDVGVICETVGANLTKDDSTHSLDHSISLSDELGQIFDSGDGCDFLIVVQSATGNKQEDGTPEMAGTTICAHKMILSRFPFFRASEETTNITVTISQSCQPHFTSLIRYMYTRKLDVTISSVQCLHSMASEFGMKQLMENVGQLFSKILPEDASFHSQLSLHKYAEETGDLVLQENCIQYLAWNFQNLIRSPAWTGLSVELLGALLSRSDLVVPDEYFLLQTLESWITEKGNSTSLETQVDLLSRIRFPMIPMTKLYDLDSNSSLYDTHKNMYNENLLKAFQFNLLLFSNLPPNQKFNKEENDYQPRIYIAEPWSSAIDPATANDFSYGSYQSFSTPFHNSLIFKDNRISWVANVFLRQHQCSNRGLSCESESLPTARLVPQTHLGQRSNILFRNQLLLICQGKYICHVQDFKDNLAHITVNGTNVFAYPCPKEQYIYRFVVRPEHI
ncbi:putative DMBT1-like protein [Symphorus nematophorus]